MFASRSGSDSKKDRTSSSKKFDLSVLTDKGHRYVSIAGMHVIMRVSISRCREIEGRDSGLCTSPLPTTDNREKDNSSVTWPQILFPSVV